MADPRFAVIIPSYKDHRLVRAITSVVAADPDALTRIYVLDGESGSELVDAAAEVLRSHDVLVSEADRGVFDALNKGLERSEEALIGWLGADDEFPEDPGFFTALERHFTPGVDAVVLDSLLHDGHRVSRIIRCGTRQDFLRGRHNGHFSTFVRRSALGSARFSLDYGSIADIPFFFDLFDCLSDESVLCIPFPGVFMSEGGISNSGWKTTLRTNARLVLAMRPRLGSLGAILFVLRKLASKLNRETLTLRRVRMLSRAKSWVFRSPKIEALVRRKLMFERKIPEQELLYVRSLPPSAGLAVDVGAAEGFYSYSLARVFAKVLAFEPLRQQFSVLRLACDSNVTPYRLALSDKAADRATMYAPVSDSRAVAHEASLVRPAEGADSDCETESVRVSTLDAMLDTGEAGGRPLEFLKIDVEGHERAVLRGGLEAIAKHAPTIMCEIEERHDAAWRETFALLHSAGYRPHVFHQGELYLLDDVDLLPQLQSNMRRFIRLSPGLTRYELPYVNNFIFLREAYGGDSAVFSDPGRTVLF